VYVDDIIITASTSTLLSRIVDRLSGEFAIKDLGALCFFIGVQVRHDASGFFLTQSQYAEDVLDRAGMLNCKPTSTPADTKPKLSIHDGTPLSATDASFYRSIAGALQYLTLTRPDVAYAVNQACLYMHAPQDIHWHLLKRILRYLRGTLNQGLTISASSTTQLTAYFGDDWAGYPDTRRSTSGYCVSSVSHWFLGHPNGRRRSHVLARKRSTVVLLMRWQNVAGCATCSANCSWTCPCPQSFTVTMFWQSTYRRIRFIIAAQNMSN
jgi:hypothetical protein